MDCLAGVGRSRHARQCHRRHRPTARPPGVASPLVMVAQEGALAGAAPMLGFVVATRLTTAANAIFLVYTAPLYVALLSPWVLHEPIRRGDWLRHSARHARAGLFLC